eukprot:symbB.v1.2.030494.t1/scaffold3435.1/size56750/4
MKSLTRSQLEVVVQTLAFIPHLGSTNNGLGHSVFNACLAAPLQALELAALVGAMRSAWALGPLVHRLGIHRSNELGSITLKCPLGYRKRALRYATLERV